jgi:ABC-type transport system involved in multi-copper enzyme maturation permease subunit
VTLRWEPKVRLTLPLLSKELTELAARRRTYSVRALYAAVLFAVFAFMFYVYTASLTPSPALLLGVGRQLLGHMFVAQLVGVYVFLPAMVSGCVTEEKEKRTLELLLITDLTPGEIVMQKLVGRLVPMLTLLLLSLPIMAVCYSLGGLSAHDVTLNAIVLVTTCVQVGAFSVMISAYSRTSSEALIATYGYAVLIYIAVWIAAGIAGSVLGMLFGPPGIVPWIIATGLMPPAAVAMGWAGGGSTICVIVAAWGWSALFVWRARRYLVERLFIPPKRRKHSFFGGMIRYARLEAARRGKRGRDDTRHLPGDEPILWRDTANTYLDWPHGFRATMGFVMFPVGLLTFCAALSYRPGRGSGWISFLVHALWIVAGVVVTVRSSRAFALERANRTLDVLLSTPLPARDIVRQKMKASWLLVLLFAAPLAMAYAMEAWLEMGRYSVAEVLDAALYLAAAGLAVFVFLPAFGWVSLLVGMRLRDARRATLLALGVFFVWNAGPVAIMATASSFGGFAMSGSLLLLAVPSPGFVIEVLEYGSWEPTSETTGCLLALMGIAMNAALLFLVRRACLKNADRYLGRPRALVTGGGAARFETPTKGGVA